MNDLYLDEEHKLLNPRRRDLEPKAGARSFTPMRVKGIDPKTRTVTALVSTPNIDRYEEIVNPEAFAKWLPVFMPNPVFCAGHTYGGRAGEPTVIGHWTDMRITKEGMIGTALFARTPLAEQYWHLYAERHMRAFSVGWLTHAFEMKSFTVARKQKTLRVFTECELIEVSAVAIPANRESLVRAASAGAVAQAEADILGDDEGEELSNRRLNKTLARSLPGALAPALRSALGIDPGCGVRELVSDIIQQTIFSLQDSGHLPKGFGQSSLAGGEPLSDDDEADSLDGYDEAGAPIGSRAATARTARRAGLEARKKELLKRMSPNDRWEIQKREEQQARTEYERLRKEADQDPSDRIEGLDYGG